MNQNELLQMINRCQKDLNNGANFEDIKKEFESLPEKTAWPVSYKKGKILSISPVLSRYKMIPVATIITEENFFICEDISKVLIPKHMKNNLAGAQVDIIEIEDIEKKVIKVSNTNFI